MTNTADHNNTCLHYTTVMGSSVSNDDKQADVRVVTLDSEDGDLGHTPKKRFNAGKLAKSFVSRDAWLGDYVSLTSPVVL